MRFGNHRYTTQNKKADREIRVPQNPKNILKEGDVAHGRIAVIGAGLTGVSSAAHAVAHGFDVVIYEGASFFFSSARARSQC